MEMQEKVSLATTAQVVSAGEKALQLASRLVKGAEFSQEGWTAHARQLNKTIGAKNAYEQLIGELTAALLVGNGELIPYSGELFEIRI